MSRSQSTVIWLGLVLIAFNLIIHVGEIKSVLFGSASGSKAPANTNTGGNSAAPAPTPTPNTQPTPPNVQVV